MRILHVSDVHFGTEDRAALDAFAAHVRDDPPALVVVTGDLSAFGRKREFAAAAAWLSSLACEIVAMPGNHDVPYLNPMARAASPFDRYRRAIGRRWAVRWKRPQAVVTPLNTARAIQLRLNWARGAISERQIARAEAILRAAPPDALRIVASHHPLTEPPGTPIPARTRGGSEAAERLAAAGAQIFLSGHVHAARVWPVAKGAFAVGAGTLSARVRGEPAGFNEIVRAPDGAWLVYHHAAGVSRPEAPALRLAP